MKEIWMEKLIELLNEFETPQSWIVFKSYDDYDGTFYWVDIDGETEIAWSDSYICGKRFQWIKWLVENDKIDLWEKLFNLTKNDNRKSIICDLDNNDFSWEDTFLMLLSISSSPIDDLISYLK